MSAEGLRTFEDLIRRKGVVDSRLSDPSDGATVAMRRWVEVLFFSGLLVLGFAIYDDFGVSWDEAGIHDYGGLLLEHYGPGGEWESYSNLRFYGPIIPLLLGIVGRLTASPEQAYPLGHFLLYLIFVAGVFAFYKLCDRQLHSWRWALFGATLLVASPRVFSHAFVNPKDAPLMALFVIAVYCLIAFLDTGRNAWLLWCGVVTALAIDTRVVGILLVALTVGAVVADAVSSSAPRRYREMLLSLALYGGTVIPLTILFWPFLWHDPVGRFLETLDVMSGFVQGPQETLYMGELVPTVDTPWHYLPVWIGITTPLPYLALALVGLAELLQRLPMTAFRDRSRDRFLYVYGAWAFLPIAAVIATKAHLYDEWRQVLFLYPALLLFSVTGAASIHSRLARLHWSRGYLQRAWVLVLAAVVAATAYKMVTLHPYQAVYFNAVVGGAGGAQGRFELDYWGLSYREGLEHLLATTSGEIALSVCNVPGPGVDNAELFPDRERLVYVSLQDADYAMCAPRTESPNPYLPELPTVYTVKREGATLLYTKLVRR